MHEQKGEGKGKHGLAKFVRSHDRSCLIDARRVLRNPQILVWHIHIFLNIKIGYPVLSGERRPLPCINFKDLACPAELPRWLS